MQKPDQMPGVADHMVPPGQVEMDGGALGSDGNRWVMLQDAQELDITPQVKGNKFYTFTATAQKHIFRIAANGWPLATDRVVPHAKFCVGQKISLTSYMTPTIDDQVQKLDVEWSLPNLFVNYIESWPAGAQKYLIDWNLLFQQNTAAWWVAGGEKHPRCDWTITFKNGQTAKVATNGRMAMHRPAFGHLIPHPPFYPAIDTIWGAMALCIGDMNQNGRMIYEYSIRSEFPGLANTTQLINRKYKRDLYPFNFTTDGYDLDTTEWYNSNNAKVYPDTEAWLPIFIDAPGVWTGRTYITIQDCFQDYVRFLPDGADSIWITIARIDWSWLGSATSDNGWIPPSGSVATPAEFDDSTFPFWLDILSGVGGD
jgi:hypothetical protein